VPTETRLPLAAAPRGLPTSETASALAARLALILQEAEETGGTYGMVVEHQASGDRLEHNPHRIFRPASVYKLGLACEVLRQVDAARLGLEDPLVIETDDVVEAEPAGGPGPGEEVTVREALRAMMGISSNTAAHALLRRLGRSQFNMAIQAVGLRATRVATQPDEPSVTTPADTARLLTLVARGEILTDASRRELRELLALPKPSDPLEDALPPGTPVYSKTGDLESASNVAGLIQLRTGTVTLAIFSEDVNPGDARKTIGAIARALYAGYGR
jgi:beta-lactamase class A